MNKKEQTRQKSVHDGEYLRLWTDYGQTMDRLYGYTLYSTFLNKRGEIYGH